MSFLTFHTAMFLSANDSPALMMMMGGMMRLVPWPTDPECYVKKQVRHTRKDAQKRRGANRACCLLCGVSIYERITGKIQGERQTDNRLGLFFFSPFLSASSENFH